MSERIVFYKNTTRYNQLVGQMQNSGVITAQIEIDKSSDELEKEKQTKIKSVLPILKFNFSSKSKKNNSNEKTIQTQKEYNLENIQFQNVLFHLSKKKIILLDKDFDPKSLINEKGLIRFAGKFSPVITGENLADRHKAYFQEQYVEWKWQIGNKKVIFLLNREGIITPTIINTMLTDKNSSLSLECVGTIISVIKNQIKVLPILLLSQDQAK